jgi:dUTP pyrophosphatase
MTKFKKVSRFANVDLPIPVRKTASSAGYDFVVAENVMIPSYTRQLLKMAKEAEEGYTYTLDAVKENVKKSGAKPTLVSTGMKCYLEPNQYLELSVRSSTPLKHWLILANGVGIIDADYADNSDNEGEIFFQLINLSPYNIVLHKGDIIGQGIIKNYEVTDDDKPEQEARVGGFGSTSKKATIELPPINVSKILSDMELEEMKSLAEKALRNSLGVVPHGLH